MTRSIPVSFYRKAIAFLSAVCFAGLSFAAGVATWTDASGDHRWNNAANWEPKAVATWQNEIHIPSGTWTIDIGTGERYYGPLIIDEGLGSVTFTGSGTLSRSGYADLSIGAGRELIVDGCTFPVGSSLKWDGATLRVRSGEVRLDQTATLGGTCRVCVDGGMFGGTGVVDLSITNSASLIISGGLVHLRSYKVYGSDEPGESGGLIRLTGGTLHNDSDFGGYFTKIIGGRFENLGGTVLWGNSSEGSGGNNRLSSESGNNHASGETFALFLPPVGAILDIPSTTARGELGALTFAVPGDYSFGGTVFVTNATADAKSACVYFGDGDNYNSDKMTVNVSGGATVFANTIRTKKFNTQNLDFSALYLGSGGIQQGQDCVTRFINDLVLGAWGDWSALRGPYCRITFAGNLVFDTLDCFDKTTPHTITVQAGFLDVTSIKAVGGGSVALSPSNYETPWPDLLHSIVVGDNTGLSITNSSQITAIRTSALKLGAGSTLTFDVAEKRYIDVLGHLEVGSGARIVAKAPTSLTAGKIHPVFLAPADFDIPDGLVQLEGSLPSGWSLVRRANFLYLSDGEVSYTTTSSQFYRYWSGAAADGDVDNVGNWTTNEIPFTAGTSYRYAFACFEGSKNMDVTISSPKNAYGINLTEKAGPFIFTGETINLFYAPANRRGGGSATYGGVMSKSDLPCVVRNDVKNDGRVYYALNYQSGSISLMGDQVQTSGTSDFYFCGDVRLGGTWNLSYFNVNTNSTALVAKRPHTLTLLSGASLSASDQDAQDFDRKQQFSLAPSSTLTIGGTTCRFLVANTHYIDGTLTVNGTLDAQAKQTFFGDGTNKFQSATGELDFRGGMTIVPGSLVGDVAISLKGEPTIAPVSDWTLGGDANIDIDDHSTLTLATGGHKLTLAKPIVSKGNLSVTGNGTVENAAEGMSLDKVTKADGATFAVAKDILASGAYVDVLTVHDDDDSIAFSPAIRKLRKRVDENGYTVYSVKGEKGMMLIYR